MEIIEIITAFALALGFLLLLWMVKGLLLRPTVCGRNARITAVITADVSTSSLEREVTNLRWLRKDGRLYADILIVDAGMDAQTREIAEALRREDASIGICTPDKIANYITRSTGNGAER